MMREICFTNFSVMKKLFVKAAKWYFNTTAEVY